MTCQEAPMLTPLILKRLTISLLFAVAASTPVLLGT